MSTTRKNFLGVPIEGNIDASSRRVAQRPLSELNPIVRAVLDDDTIVEFGWRQYTPYFNDGDPCVFSIDEPWFKTTAELNDTEYDEWDLLVDDHPSLGTRPRRWNTSARAYDVDAYVGPDEARYDRCRALARAICSGEFDDVLLDAFGDHAVVTIRRSGITVELYEHE